MSRREIERLSQRLAGDEPPSADDVEQLASFQSDYQPALQHAVDFLRDRLHITSTGLFDGVALTASTRPAKTVDTLRDKLRRGLALRTIQDIVGIRIVGDMTLSQQDALCDSLVHGIGATRVDVHDRRVSPSFGYRAVHVVPHIGPYPVEIQIRTGWQDGWAQGSEKLGDVWGRWHRYGLAPEGPTAEERQRRSTWIAQYIRMGDAIYAHELALDVRFRLRRREEELGELLERGAGDEAAKELSGIADRVREAQQDVIATNRALVAETEVLRRISG